MVTGSAVQLASVIIQSLAIAVAFTVLLGRVYVLSYYENLGIPVSEAKLSAIDYSIFSPAIAILGVGLAVLLGTFPLVARQLTKEVVARKVKLRVGFGLAALGVIVLLASIAFSQYATPYPVLRGIWIVVSQALGVYGFAMIGSASHSEPTRASTDNTSATDKLMRLSEKRTILRWALVGLGIMLVVSMVSFAVISSSNLGRVDAATTLKAAPQARVEFVSGGTFDMPQYLKVVMISDRFIYLLREKVESSRQDRVVRLPYRSHCKN